MRRAPSIVSACSWRAISSARRWRVASRRQCTPLVAIPTGGKANASTVPLSAGPVVTGEVVRDTVQKVLVGRPGQAGTGAIPKDAIAELVSARGTPDLLDTIRVNHVSGGVSIIGLKTYASGREKFQGETLDFVWMDEECASDIYTEALTRTNVGANPVWMTFTPLQGVSTVVKRFLHEKSDDRHKVVMTIDDVNHYTAPQKETIIKSYPAHELEARIKGIPVLGSGRIFPVSEESIAIDNRDFPPHFPRICGMDFGWDHPFAAVELVWDRDSDTVYVSRTHRLKEATPILHASAIRAWGKELPWAWPRDGRRETLEGAWRRSCRPIQSAGLKPAAPTRAVRGRLRVSRGWPDDDARSDADRAPKGLQTPERLVGRIPALSPQRRQGCQRGRRSNGCHTLCAHDVAVCFNESGLRQLQKADPLSEVIPRMRRPFVTWHNTTTECGSGS